jgi:hypothetical protein
MPEGVAVFEGKIDVRFLVSLKKICYYINVADANCQMK